MYIWFEHHLDRSTRYPKFDPIGGSNPWPSHHDSAFHVPETPVLATGPSRPLGHPSHWAIKDLTIYRVFIVCSIFDQRNCVSRIDSMASASTHTIFFPYHCHICGGITAVILHYVAKLHLPNLITWPQIPASLRGINILPRFGSSQYYYTCIMLSCIM